LNMNNIRINSNIDTKIDISKICSLLFSVTGSRYAAEKIWNM